LLMDVVVHLLASELDDVRKKEVNEGEIWLCPDTGGG